MFEFFLARSCYYYSIILGIALVLGRYPCYSTQIGITRTNDSLDVFTIERTNCSDSLCLSKKSLIYKSTPGSCSCRCASSASSFVLGTDLTNSTCMDNVALRSTLGQCSLLLGSNTIDSPVSALDLSTPGSVVLTGLNGSSACSVYQQEFLDNGTWSAAVAVRNLTTFTTDINLLKWASVVVYAGRIVRVRLHCNVGRLCVVFKVQGTIWYNISAGYRPVSPTSIALQPSPSTRYSGSTVTQLASSSSTKDLVPPDTSSISPTLATVVIVTSSAVLIDTRGTKAVLDSCERGAWVFCQRVYLVIAAAGTVILLALGFILLSCVCIRRRRRRILHHQKPVFFKSGLTTEIDSSTELALIEDAKPGNKDRKEPTDKEEFYQNVPRREKPDNNQQYRPLRFSDGQDSPTTPVSPGRFSSGSSTDDVTLYDDTTDSNQLIKNRPGSNSPIKPDKRFKTFCPSPVMTPKKEHLGSRKGVWDTEEEATYEIIETKTLPPGSGTTNRANVESITGIENQVFEEDDNRQSHYEIIPTDEQLNYENLDGACREEQSNYETMGEPLPYGENELGLNNQQTDTKDYFDEEQINYETMENNAREEQRNYEIMDQNDRTQQLKPACDRDISDENEEEMEDEREYDIPELSLDCQEDQDEPDYHYVVNTSSQSKIIGLTVPSEMKSDDDNDSDDYMYANVPETQADTLREIIRNSRHSGDLEVQRGDDKNKSTRKAAVEKTRDLKRPTSLNTAGRKNETNEEDNEELYTLPGDFPKPLPSYLLKGGSSPQLKRPQTKDLIQNQAASSKKTQRSAKLNPDSNRVLSQGDRTTEQHPEHSRVASSDSRAVRTPEGKGKKDKSSLKHLEHSRESSPEGRATRTPEGKGKKDKSSLKHLEHSGESSPDVSSTKNGQPTVDRQHGMEVKVSSQKGNNGSLKPQSEDGTLTHKRPRKQPSKEKPARRKPQPSSKNKESVVPTNEKENNKNTGWDSARKTTGNENIQQEKPPEDLTQPLYANLVEMENEQAPLSANLTSTDEAHNSNDTNDEQQPLYENVSEMVNRVG